MKGYMKEGLYEGLCEERTVCMREGRKKGRKTRRTI
jgi:hypothetical protein